MVTDAGAIPPPEIDARLGDPFARVLALGNGEDQRLRTSVIVALALYAGGAAHGLAFFTELHAFAADVLWTVSRVQYQLDVEPPPPPPPEPPKEEPPPPEPEPAPPPKAAAPTPATPPPAAQAGKVLTADPDPNEPVDLTGGFVQGTGDTFVGGVTTSTGTNRNAVYDMRAVGSAAPVAAKTAPVAAGPDLSRAAKPLSGSWDCGFPAEADIEQINYARVTITVTVTAEGQAKSVSVLQDPGYGFGSLTKQCALRKRYAPALNKAGQPQAATQVITINYTR